jgi:hypothetical protein
MVFHAVYSEPTMPRTTCLWPERFHATEPACWQLLMRRSAEDSLHFGQRLGGPCSVRSYLRQQRSARATDLAYVHGTGSWTEGLAQWISQLDWLGIVTVFWRPAGEPSLLQNT